MTVKEMHYDFKQKLNKIDSNQFRNLLVPEIDWLLNSATLEFIKMTVNPRYNPIEGFEKRQRDRDDIKNIVVNDFQIPFNNKIIIGNELSAYIYPLPDDYLFYVSARVEMNKTNCDMVLGNIIMRQYDDEFNQSPFDKSSFEWREVNATMFNEGMKCFTDNSFELNNLWLNYIQQFPYIHNAEDFHNNQYTDLRGNILTGTQDCILSEHTHSEIVDIAVLLATINLQIPDLNTKLNKLKLT